MNNRPIIIVQQQSAFARHAKLLGLSVEEIGSTPCNLTSQQVEQCEALFWALSSMCHVFLRNRVMGMLLRVPKDCTRILDFNLQDVAFADKNIIRESLSCSDMLILEKRDLTTVSQLLGLQSQSVFDMGFDLMAAFGIKTLILNHGIHGCHVFHGNAVSERFGHLNLSSCQVEEAEGAFAAAFYAASRNSKRLFSECHRMALDYLKYFVSSSCGKT